MGEQPTGLRRGYRAHRLSRRAYGKTSGIKGGGALEIYLRPKALEPFINKDLILERFIPFRLPEVEGLKTAVKGLPAELFIEIAQAARDSATPAPVAACVMSPWTDLALTGDSIATRAKHDPLLTLDALDHTHNASDPRASPLHGDPTGLPPILLHVGEDEILLDDARRYADLVAKSGSAAELHVWQGMVHVFPANVALLQAARGARYHRRIPAEQSWPVSVLPHLFHHHQSNGETP